MKKLCSLFVIAGLAIMVLTLAGCTRRMIDFTMISSKDLGMTVPDDAKGTRVEGRDEVYWLFTIPLGTPDLKEATDRAIEAAGAGYDALIDGVVYSYGYWFVVSGVNGFKVTGTPIKSSMVATLLEERPDLEGQAILYHSTVGKSNDQAWETLLAREPSDKLVAPASTSAD